MWRKRTINRYLVVSKPEVNVRELLNAQTGRIGWDELQRHFARGALLHVDASLDLIEAAAAIVENDTTQLKAWLESRVVAKASLDQARHWQSTQAEFWAVIAAPWVLVQPTDQR